MKVLLLNPPIEDFFFTPQRAFPLGTLSLATVLDGNGIAVRLMNSLEEYTKQTLPVPEVFAYLKRYYRVNRSPFGLFSHYYRFGKSDEAIRRAVREFHPGVVGISANFTPYLDSAFNLAALIKKIDRRIVVVLGGRAATASAELLLAHPTVDFVIRGEAEYSFLRLCRALSSGAMPRISGLCYKVNKTMRIAADSALVNDLNELPVLNRSLLDPSGYRFQGKISTSLLASRGCTRGCRFCAIREPFRYRGVEHVMAELEDAYRLGVRHFNFEDDTMNLNPVFMPLLERIIEQFPGKVTLSFMNGLLAEGINPAVRKKLFRAGLTHIDLAIASSRRELRRSLRRKDDIRKIFQLAAVMSRNNVPATVHYIVGFPGQRFPDALRDLRMLACKPVLLGPSIFYPVMESALFPEIQKIFTDPDRQYPLFRSSAASFDRDITRDRIFSLLYGARIINFIKELSDSEDIPKADLRQFIRRRARGIPVRNKQVRSSVKLERRVLGIIALDLLFRDFRVYRVEQSSDAGNYLYRFIEEEFVSSGDLRKMLSGLRVRGVSGKTLRLEGLAGKNRGGASGRKAKLRHGD